MKKPRFLLGMIIALAIITIGCAGTNGQDGQDGTDGINGIDGTNGTNGTNGQDGAAGADGTDAANTCAVGCHDYSGDVGQNVFSAKSSYVNSGHFLGPRTYDETGPYGTGATSHIFVHHGSNAMYCAESCHNHNAFVYGTYANAQLEDLEASPGQIGCMTCHDPHNNGDFTLRKEAAVTLATSKSDNTTATGWAASKNTFNYGAGNLCANCHQARRAPIDYTQPADDQYDANILDAGAGTLGNDMDLDTSSTAVAAGTSPYIPAAGYPAADTDKTKDWPNQFGSSTGPHHGPQADVIAGSGYYNFADLISSGTTLIPPQQYGGASPHSAGDSCINCHHMPVTPGSANMEVAGHAFYLKADVHGTEINYTKACMQTSCHPVVDKYDPYQQLTRFDMIAKWPTADLDGDLNTTDYDMDGLPDAETVIQEIQGMAATLIEYFGRGQNFAQIRLDQGPGPLYTMNKTEILWNHFIWDTGVAGEGYYRPVMDEYNGVDTSGNIVLSLLKDADGNPLCTGMDLKHPVTGWWDINFANGTIYSPSSALAFDALALGGNNNAVVDTAELVKFKNMSVAQIGALWNLKVYLEDKSGGVHNPLLIAQMLFDSIKALNTYDIVNVPSLPLGTTRPLNGF